MGQSPISRGSPDLQEMPISPAWTVDGQGVHVTRKFRGTYALCFTLLQNLPIGAVVATGFWAGLRILNTRLDREAMDLGVVTFEMKGGLLWAGLPFDEISVDWGQQEFALERHPRYDFVSDDSKQAALDWAKALGSGDRAKLGEKFAADPLTQELALKLARGETHFVIFAPKYRWTSYFLVIPSANGGAFLQTPNGPLVPPPGWSWLRAADALEWNGSYWKLTREWIGSGLWDADIYPTG